MSAAKGLSIIARHSNDPREPCYVGTKITAAKAHKEFEEGFAERRKLCRETQKSLLNSRKRLAVWAYPAALSWVN
jgi:hypothetical protein